MKLMYNCREMVDLVSEELDHDLTLFTRLKMAMHFMLCKKCRIYQEQVHCVDLFLANHFVSLERDSEMVSLSDEARDRIENAINISGIKIPPLD